MKTVELRLVRELARLTRKYARIGDVDLLPAAIYVAKEMSEQAFHDDMHWDGFKAVCSIVCGVSPMKMAGTNEDIINILHLLGIEVIDNECDASEHASS